MRPTQQAYHELQQAYDHFNRHLFGGALPPCLITLHRKQRTYGYFLGKAFVNRAGAITDEIAMNPEHFTRPMLEVLATLTHEMAHLWQAHKGTPGRGRYHNQEWSRHMEALGLVPSDTGAPGGNKTGDQMSHYIAEGGRFSKAAAKLLTGAFTLSWIDRFQAEVVQERKGKQKQRPNRSNRLKYSCPTCSLNVWGKPGLVLRCGICLEGSIFLPVE